MDKIISPEAEYSLITKMILKGNTTAQIASKLNYSVSTVSNRLNILFQKYNAKNRFEFVCNFLTKIIKKYKKEIELVNYENTSLKNQLTEIKQIIISANPIVSDKTIGNTKNCDEFFKI